MEYWSALEWWSGGVVEWWSGGVVEWWSGGVLEYWSIGVVERWSEAFGVYCSCNSSRFGSLDVTVFLGSPNSRSQHKLGPVLPKRSADVLQGLSCGRAP